MTGTDLENHLERYLELRRALGFEMRVEGRLLRDFLTSLQERTLAGPLIAQAAVEWASSRGGSKYQAGRLSMARCFLAHLRAQLPGIQVPAPGMIPSGVRPTPHIYSEAQIAALMREASALKPTGSLRPHTYATLIGLHWCPVRSRIESVGCLDRISRSRSRTPEVPVKWAFSRRASRSRSVGFGKG
jgi:integrase/recombinase XerC